MFEMLAHEHELGSETLSSCVVSSVDNVLLQTNPDFTIAFWIHQYYWILSKAAVKPCNWLAVGGHISGKMKFYKVFLLILMHILSALFSQVVRSRRWVRWKTEQPLDGQLCRKYVYQKLLKLDNFFLSYGKTNFGVFLCLTVYTVMYIKCPAKKVAFWSFLLFSQQPFRILT